MQKNLGMMGLFYTITEWIMRFSLINAFWILLNLPILMLILLIVIRPMDTGVIVHMITLAVMSPFILFPSTMAVFAIARFWIMQNEQKNLLISYWQNLKNDYKNYLLSGTILTLIWLVWILDLQYFRTQSELFSIVMLLVGVMLFVYTIIFFCLSVHFRMKQRELLRNAFFITTGSPLLFIAILTIYILLFYASLNYLILFLFFTISISAFLSFFVFYRFMHKVEKKTSKSLKISHIEN